MIGPRGAATASDGIPLGLNGTLARCVPALLISLLISLFVTLSVLAVPIYMMQVYDRVLTSRSIPTLIWLTVVVVGALVVHGVLQLSRSLVHQRLGEWLGERLGEVAIPATVGRALRDGNGSTQSLRDANEVRSFFAGRSLPTAMEMLWTPLFFIVLFLLHPAYGLIAVGGAAMLAALGILNEVVSHRSLVSASDASVRAHQHIGSAVRNAEIVEAMGLIDRIVARWRQANAEAAVMARRGHLRSEAISASSRSLRLSLQVLLIAVGAALIIERAVGPGTLFAAMIILGRALAPYEQLIDGWRQWLSAWAAVRRLRGIEADAAPARSTMGMARPSGPLEIDRLVYVPPGASRPTIRGVSLVVEPGEVLAIMGPSGAGKSTLARLIMGVWKPTSGAVRLDGQDVHQWDRAAFGSVSGYLPQQVGLFDATIAENIARLTEAAPEDVVNAARRADVHGLIGRLPYGYDTEITDPGFLLTGGQRQRIGLARALFGEPRLLVLDEPDANLDQAGSEALLSAIAWARSTGAIIILISHRNTLLSIADRILELRDGVAVRVADAVTEPVPEIVRRGPAALPAGRR
ncbi:ATP-binding cassette subfamily C protein [Stella humosa]|uniref:ATP-binding cassette subfamily C protein n=1 Tax=Stella humosa TaxID=94 RepID=A0A3N1MGX4_9PROT|nr:type I secretion system permease/ATPase [Stella humosa]ROQ02017.1 ATP-binding cassette subfamily C protein [Stella humosa]BBK32407.1 ABC transporter ATP-binding protein [Stella humosa]